MKKENVDDLLPGYGVVGRRKVDARPPKPPVMMTVPEAATTVGMTRGALGSLVRKGRVVGAEWVKEAGQGPGRWMVPIPVVIEENPNGRNGRLGLTKSNVKRRRK